MRMDLDGMHLHDDDDDEGDDADDDEGDDADDPRTPYQLLFDREDKAVALCSCERYFINREHKFNLYCHVCKVKAKARKGEDLRICFAHVPGLCRTAASYAIQTASRHIRACTRASQNKIAEWAVLDGEVPANAESTNPVEFIGQALPRILGVWHSQHVILRLTGAVEDLIKMDREIRKTAMESVFATSMPDFILPPNMFLPGLLAVVGAYTYTPWLRMEKSVHLLRCMGIPYQFGIPAFGLLLYHLLEAKDEQGIVDICAVTYQAKPIEPGDETRWVRRCLISAGKLATAAAATAMANDVSEQVVAIVRQETERRIHMEATKRVHTLTVEVYEGLLSHVAKNLGVVGYQVPLAFLRALVQRCVSVSKKHMSELENCMKVEPILPVVVTK